MRRNNTGTVGILGGMGPYATMAFYKLLLEETPAKKDWDHLHAVLDINTKIPSRSRYHLFGEASPIPGMIDSCKRLESYPVDLIAIPCNSACAYIDQIRPHIGIPILDIVEIAAASARELCPSAGKAAVLGGIVTYEKMIYAPFLSRHAIEHARHSRALQNAVEKLIERIKTDSANQESHRTALLDIVTGVVAETGAEAVILGCTEFGGMADIAADACIIDSSRALARRVVDMLCQGE